MSGLETVDGKHNFSETARSAERSCFSNLHVPCPWGASLKLDVGPSSKSFFSDPRAHLPVGCSWLLTSLKFEVGPPSKSFFSNPRAHLPVGPWLLTPELLNS